MDGSDEEAIERELAQLASRPAPERAEFLAALGWSRLGRPTPGLEPFLDDSDPQVRIAAAQAVRQTGQDDKVLDRLVGVLVEELCGGDEDTALMAGTALVNMEDAAVAPLIRQFVDRGEKDPLIVRVLGEIAGEEAMSFLRDASRSTNADVVREASAALEAIEKEGL